MQDSMNKNVIINALYYYQNNACAEEQIDCLNMFGCEPYKSVDLNTDPDKRASYFETIIGRAIRSLDEE
jgi:hypothetical protein